MSAKLIALEEASDPVFDLANDGTSIPFIFWIEILDANVGGAVGLDFFNCSCDWRFALFCGASSTAASFAVK